MGSDEEKPGKSKFMTALPLLLLLVSIPLSLTLWLGNMAFSAFWESESEPIPPTRWLFSVITPILFAAYGLKKKSLSVSGAVLGLLVGFVLTLSSYLFLVCLIVFFITSSRATKFRSDRKRKLEHEFKEGGQRNWVQVLCNSGMALQLALLYILDSGCGERPIDFSSDYRSSWLALGVLGSLSCCNGDTWASELGTVVGGGQPRLITSGRPVPPGTNGGVSPQGLLFSLLGGLVVGVGYYAALLYFVDTTSLARSPPQWPIVLWAAFAGFFGSLVDSLLGATVQFSGLDKKRGYVVECQGPGVKHISGLGLLDNHSVSVVSVSLDKKRGCVVECPGPGVKHISGLGLLDNHSVNLVSSIITGLVTPVLANLFWPH